MHAWLNIEAGVNNSPPNSHDQSGRRIDSSYELMQHRLGTGHFSTVRLALKRETRIRVAVKVVQRRDASRTAKIEREVDILRMCNRLNHPHIVRLLDYFDGGAAEVPAESYLVFEYLPDGSLLDHLQEVGSMPEFDARSIVRQIASALKAIHDVGIVHRDVKPENVLFAENGNVKLVDFGFAKSARSASGGGGGGGGAHDNASPSGGPAALASRRFAVSPCGTPGFVAPEVLQHTGYNCAVDMWSLGVITFMCLFGSSPFSDTPHSPAPAELHRAPEAINPYNQESDDDSDDMDEALDGEGEGNGVEAVGASCAAVSISAPPLRRDEFASILGNGGGASGAGGASAAPAAAGREGAEGVPVDVADGVSFDHGASAAAPSSLSPPCFSGEVVINASPPKGEGEGEQSDDDDGRSVGIRLMGAGPGVTPLSVDMACMATRRRRRSTIQNPLPATELASVSPPLTPTSPTEPPDSVALNPPAPSAPAPKTSVRIANMAPSVLLSPTSERKAVLLSRTARGAFRFPDSPGSKQTGGDTPDAPLLQVGTTARAFITALLQVDPTSRLTAGEALQHIWLDTTRLAQIAGGGSSGDGGSPNPIESLRVHCSPRNGELRAGAVPMPRRVSREIVTTDPAHFSGPSSRRSSNNPSRRVSREIASTDPFDGKSRISPRPSPSNSPYMSLSHSSRRVSRDTGRELFTREGLNSPDTAEGFSLRAKHFPSRRASADYIDSRRTSREVDSRCTSSEMLSQSRSEGGGHGGDVDSTGPDEGAQPLERDISPSRLPSSPRVSFDNAPEVGDAIHPSPAFLRRPLERTPLERTPLESTPLERTPLERTPLERTPLERTPLERTPLERTPLECTPLERTPLERTPLERTPLERTPLERTPLERTPLERALRERARMSPVSEAGIGIDAAGANANDPPSTTAADADTAADVAARAATATATYASAPAVSAAPQCTAASDAPIRRVPSVALLAPGSSLFDEGPIHVSPSASRAAPRSNSPGWGWGLPLHQQPRPGATPGSNNPSNSLINGALVRESPCNGRSFPNPSSSSQRSKPVSRLQQGSRASVVPARVSAGTVMPRTQLLPISSSDEGESEDEAPDLGYMRAGAGSRRVVRGGMVTDSDSDADGGGDGMIVRPSSSRRVTLQPSSQPSLAGGQRNGHEDIGNEFASDEAATRPPPIARGSFRLGLVSHTARVPPPDP